MYKGKSSTFFSGIAMLLCASILMSGCNRNNADAEAAPEEETAAADTQSGNFDNVISVSGTADDSKNRINFIRPEPSYDESAFSQPDETEEFPAQELEDTDMEVPQYFDVEDPLEPLMGYCDEDMCDAIIAQLNAKRADFGVDPLTKNSSLCVAADVRAMEYDMYPVYKERPDGRSFTSVSPDGYVIDEYFIRPARNSIHPVWDPQIGMYKDNNPPYQEGTYTPATVMKGMLEIREARNILLNPDYKQVGAAWYVTGHYFIAGFTFSY